MQSEEDLVKLRLLTLSQNMLMAAQEANWQELSELDYKWKIELEKSIEQHRCGVETIYSQLLENNKAIEDILNTERNKLIQEKAYDSVAHNAIKQYLK